METTKGRIAGTCENCGYAYKGVVEMKDGAYPRIACPVCKKETQNFDEEETILANDRVEGMHPYNGYNESEFTEVSE